MSCRVSKTTLWFVDDESGKPVASLQFVGDFFWRIPNVVDLVKQCQAYIYCIYIPIIYIYPLSCHNASCMITICDIKRQLRDMPGKGWHLPKYDMSRIC